MNGLFVGKCRARALSFGACRGGAEVKGGHVASQSDKSDDIDVLLSVSADFLREPKEAHRAVISSVPSQQNSSFSSSSSS